ncbi:iron chaperone [Flavobacterium sp. XGLA_31]|uniref:iron chaperone n=1 Tax=Flavobacterium sp. XGLA_31 TaxID=3447666 RepID=UPI003F3D9FB1
MKTTFNNIDHYIASQPETVQPLLESIRKTIKETAPQAEETISYQMPAFRFHGALVYFAAYKNHIGFYPTASGIKAFQNEIALYKNSKGAVQFALDKPIPHDLIAKMVRFKIAENNTKKNKK